MIFCHYPEEKINQKMPGFIKHSENINKTSKCISFPCIGGTQLFQPNTIFPTWYKGYYFQPLRNNVFLGTLFPQCVVYKPRIPPLSMLGTLHPIYCRCTNLFTSQLLSCALWDTNIESHVRSQLPGIQPNPSNDEIANWKQTATRTPHERPIKVGKYFETIHRK